ncbi:sensor histidine kinase [Ornithinimicrobium sp. W1665]|uniref:sensor histidine kinase n=1 Tax=Ornithinimicrobium sp. W1665 TaxID=3416666 RepID=UPI003CF6CBD9
MTWPRRLATAGALLTGGMLIAALVLGLMAPTPPTLLALAVGVSVVPLSTVLGLLVARGTGGNPVGTWLILVGLTVMVTVTADVGRRVLGGRPELAETLAWLVAVLAESAWWVLATVALLLLHFPDGRLPSRRWRWVPWVLVAGVLVLQARGALADEPFREPLEGLARPFGPVPAWLDALSLLALVVVLFLALASALSLVRRHRRSDLRQRRQIRWLAVGGLLVAAFPLLCLVEIAVWGRPLWLSTAVGLAGLVAIPATTGIAMLRHDLYDVDRTLAGTVTWGLVSATLLTLYAVATVLTGVTLGRESPLAAATATALGAVLLSPLRARLQAQVDRRIYPLRRAAYAALERLQSDISTGHAAPEQLDDVLRTALRDPGLRVGYRAPGGAGFRTVDGREVVAGGVAVSVGGEQVAALVPGTVQLSEELLEQVGRRAAGLVEMVRLRLELAEALRQVESSRARLVQLGYEERRRLERDLHDGAQQRLVSLGMSIRLAQRHLGDGTVDVDELLDECVAELGTAVAELRRLAHGIRPSSLDDGLPAALARLVRAVPVEVDLRVQDAVLPDDIATTAYFVISEALANAVKHAGASHIGLEVQRLDGHVVVRVSDDGRGGATLAAQSGLADRVAALGGSLSVASPPGHGTVVEAELPCAS